MKKKLVLVVIALVLILSFVLAGCNLFTLDEERDGDQVVATVKHNGLVGEVTKSEFRSYFAQNFSYYNNYFQWTAEEAGETFISILARQKMTIILAVEKITADRGIELDKEKFNAILKENVKKGDSKKGYDVYSAYLLTLLNPDEQKYVKEQTNKMFKDVYDESIETELENERIKQEEENNNSNKTEEKEARPTKDKDESTSFKKDSSVTQAEVDAIKNFFDEYRPATKPGNNASTEDKAAYDAFKDAEKNLKDSYLSYEYYLSKQAEQRILEKYQEFFKDNDTEIDVKINDSVYKTLQEQMKNYKSSDSYKSAIEGDSSIIYHNGRYVKVKSILLQFSDKQSEELKKIQAYYSSEEEKDTIRLIREALVFGKVNDSIDWTNLGYVESLLGLRVYKSNPDYDPTKSQDYENNVNLPYIKNENFDPNKEEGADNEKWLSVPFLEVIAELGAELNAINVDNEDIKNEYKEKYTNVNDEIGFKMFVAQKKIEAFDKWIYIANDDTGMFDGKEYTITPTGNATDYVVEYTALARQLLIDNGTAGSVMVDTTGSSAFGSLSGIVHQTVKVGEEVVDIYTDTTNNISFIINDYGVHIIMLTSVPVDMGYNEEGTHYTVAENTDFDMTEFEDNDNYKPADIELIKKMNSYYTLTMDAYVAFDEETGKAITLREKLTNELKETYDSTAYSKHSENLFKMYGEKLFDKKDDKDPAEGYADFKFEVSMNKSVYNGVISYFNKQING